MSGDTILCSFFTDPVYSSGLAGAVLTSIITVIVLLAGYAIQFYLFKEQIKVLREEAFKTNSIKLSFDLSNEFENELDDDRTEVGKFIINKKVLDRDFITDKEYEEISGNIENIIDFFDTLGFYIRNNYIKTDLVWTNFYYWFNNYYELYQKYKIIGFRFQNSPQVWKNIDFLMTELRKIEFSESNKKPIGPVLKFELERFFKEEGGFKPQRPLAFA